MHPLEKANDAAYGTLQAHVSKSAQQGFDRTPITRTVIDAALELRGAIALHVGKPLTAPDGAKLGGSRFVELATREIVQGLHNEARFPDRAKAQFGDAIDSFNAAHALQHLAIPAGSIKSVREALLEVRKRVAPDTRVPSTPPRKGLPPRDVPLSQKVCDAIVKTLKAVEQEEGPTAKELLRRIDQAIEALRRFEAFKQTSLPSTMELETLTRTFRAVYTGREDLRSTPSVLQKRPLRQTHSVRQTAGGARHPGSIGMEPASGARRLGSIGMKAPPPAARAAGSLHDALHNFETRAASNFDSAARGLEMALLEVDAQLTRAEDQL